MSEGDVTRIIEVNLTLAVEVQTGGNPVIRIDRHGGGLVAIQPGELRGLVDALCAAAGLLASAEAQQVVRSSARAVVEARRLRRRRVGKE